MSGIFGVVSKTDCVKDLFYGTDYHSHLGTRRGGLASRNRNGFDRFIHDITNSQFRSKFQDDINKMSGNKGIGVISDFEDQPLIITSHLGSFAIVTVGVIKNANEIMNKLFKKNSIHFSEIIESEINPTELCASLINQENTFEAGIERAQNEIEGSCSILILTDKGIYASRDRLGRTPLILGQKECGFAVTFETSAFSNLDYTVLKELGPGEIVFISEDGFQVKKKPIEHMQVCSFLWVYYGYPASTYEGVNVEESRYKNGALMAKNDSTVVDLVAGIPDSGTAHAIGFANEAKIPYNRPFVKYTPTWPRSFMPQNQDHRDLVAKMKLIPIPELIKGKKLLFCDDSIVRGTQLKDTIIRIYKAGATETHMRPACPPLIFGCKYLNFSRSRSIMDLAGRRAIKEIEGKDDVNVSEYSNPDSDKYNQMVEIIRKKMGLNTLKYQRLDSLVKAIGLPKCKLCTYCWDGCEKVK